MTFTHFAVPGERKLDGQSTSPLLRSLTGHQSPAVNIGEADSAYRITVDLPGLSKENINIDVQGRTVSIHGAFPETRLDDHFLVAERPQGTFARTFQLPLPVNGNAVTASFDQGVLEVTLPKAEESKVKRIAIS